MVRFSSFIAAGVLVLLVAACGGSDKTVVVNRLVSQQQSLTDLKRALDAGAINQTEYDQQVQKALAGK
ncbi:MAG: SHOCT domain-containing protein [Alphaproteobacteria bacterium]